MAVPDKRGCAQPRACADDADGPAGTWAGNAEHAMGARTGFGQARAGFRREIVDYPARTDAVPFLGVGQIHFQRRVRQPGFQRIGDGAGHADDERVGGAGMPIQGRPAGADEAPVSGSSAVLRLPMRCRERFPLSRVNPAKRQLVPPRSTAIMYGIGPPLWGRGNPEA